jgi:hypothetical protein
MLKSCSRMWGGVGADGAEDPGDTDDPAPGTRDPSPAASVPLMPAEDPCAADSEGDCVAPVLGSVTARGCPDAGGQVVKRVWVTGTWSPATEPPDIACRAGSEDSTDVTTGSCTDSPAAAAVAGAGVSSWDLTLGISPPAWNNVA